MIPSKTVIFFGMSGSGKGTQAKLLEDFLKKNDPDKKVIYVETGQRFREFMAKDTYTSALVKKVLDEGGLLPVFLPIWIWTDVLVDSYTGGEHMILDGLSRRTTEAPVLDSALHFYKREDPQVIILHTSKEWARDRLLNRGRADDNKLDIDARLLWYESNVVPTIDYFRNNSFYTCHQIDGERSVEAIHKDVLASLKLA